MRLRWKIATVVVALGAASAITAMLTLRQPSITLEGAVILDSTDQQKQSPIAGVSITVDREDAPAPVAETNFAGYFRLRLPPTVVSGESITLQLRHPDHQPLDVEVAAAEQLYVLRMSSAHSDEQPPPARPDIVAERHPCQIHHREQDGGEHRERRQDLRSRQ